VQLHDEVTALLDDPKFDHDLAEIDSWQRDQFEALRRDVRERSLPEKGFHRATHQVRVEARIRTLRAEADWAQRVLDRLSPKSPPGLDELVLSVLLDRLDKLAVTPAPTASPEA